MARFTLVIGSLIRAVVARSGSPVMGDAFLMLLSRRILEISHHVRRLVMAIQTGTLRTRRSPAPGGTRRPAVPGPLALPRQFGWLVRLMTSDAATCGMQLLTILEDPEMAALLAASPRLVRTLKPLCRMLAIRMPVVPNPVPPPVCATTLPGTPVPETPGIGAAAKAATGQARARPLARQMGWRRPVLLKIVPE